MKTFKQIYEDGHTAVARVRADHKRERERNKIQRDRELDREQEKEMQLEKIYKQRKHQVLQMQ